MIVIDSNWISNNWGLLQEDTSHSTCTFLKVADFDKIARKSIEKQIVRAGKPKSSPIFCQRIKIKPNILPKKQKMSPIVG